jgi:predicted DNA-binding ribbon-helix-helix protein
MNSSVVERSWVSVEDAFWKGLREIIAKRREEPLSDRQFANLSSAIRLFALGFYRTSPPFGGDIRRSRAA